VDGLDWVVGGSVNRVGGAELSGDAQPGLVRSTAMMRVAGELRAAMIAAKPTVPAPNTAIWVPGTGRTVLNTAPAPVEMPHASGPISASGYFITQQVGERNMACVKAALGQPASPPAIQPQAIADVDGRSALASAAILNRVLAGNVDERGFVTNEHRYLAIAQRVRERARG